jgi:hypothetical protein
MGSMVLVPAAEAAELVSCYSSVIFSIIHSASRFTVSIYTNLQCNSASVHLCCTRYWNCHWNLSTTLISGVRKSEIEEERKWYLQTVLEAITKSSNANSNNYYILPLGSAWCGINKWEHKTKKLNIKLSPKLLVS